MKPCSALPGANMSHKLSAENNVHNETEIIKQTVFNAKKDQNYSIVKDITKATASISFYSKQRSPM